MAITSADSPAIEPTVGAEHAAKAEEFFAVKKSHNRRVSVSMPVGTVQVTHEALEILPGSALITEIAGSQHGDCLHLSWVVPDDTLLHQYDIELRQVGKTLFRRKGSTRGFGKRSFFFPFKPADGRLGTDSAPLEIINHAAEPMYVETLDLIKSFDEWITRPVPDDDFLLALLVNDVTSTSMFARVKQLESAPGIRKAFSTEIYYAARQNEALEKQLEKIRQQCEEHDLMFLPSVCSWWAGTPPIVRDRLDFQQVCWSETDFFDEGQELKDLLGPRWNIHYGLTTPNMWSNTPWQTMNSPELNEMRHARVGEAVALTQKIVGEHVVGFIAENEPAYWAFEGSDHKYPVRRRNIAADFNPYTVADAAKDGIYLDPANGLDMMERAWLLRNVARYNERTIAAGLQNAPDAKFYSHALLDYTHFPFAGTPYARSYAEAAHVRNAYVGVEMLWDTDIDALWRVREWGRWGCVNREECDRQQVEYHTATLRACYMMGGDMMNSYNWHSMSLEGDPIKYMNQFLDEVRNGGRVVVSENNGGVWKALTGWHGEVKVCSAFPWFNEMELHVRPSHGSTSIEDLIVMVMRGNDIVAYATVSAEDVPVTGLMHLDFADLSQVNQRDTLELHLAGGKGWEAKFSEAGPDYRLICNMTAERRRSQFVLDTEPAGVEVYNCELEPTVTR